VVGVDGEGEDGDGYEDGPSHSEEEGQQQQDVVGDDLDISRNLALLAQLGLLGPKGGTSKSKTGSANKSHRKKKRAVITPSRASSRLKVIYQVVLIVSYRC
jgi:hypothetical protein